MGCVLPFRAIIAAMRQISKAVQELERARGFAIFNRNAIIELTDCIMQKNNVLREKIMKQPALTRASTLGPIVDFVKQGNGSVERVFRAAELPLQICERPDILIPLRDQFKLVELAAQELGDDALPARLSTLSKVTGLGEYGRQFMAAPTLGTAIRHGNKIYTSILQSATRMTLTVEGGMARWTYRVTELGQVGRQKNEILAIGYMLDLLRRFAGKDWTPDRVELPGAPLQGCTAVEMLYRCEISPGNIVSTVFPAELLDIPNPAPAFGTTNSCDELPTLEDFYGYVRELVRLGLLDGHPQRTWVARRLHISVRTLQRRLKEHGTSFAEVWRSVMKQQAAELLYRSEFPISEIAYELGYSDPAHFTRAFNRWFGESPRVWRYRNSAGEKGAE